MKNILLLLVFVCGTALGAFAQQSAGVTAPSGELEQSAQKATNALAEKYTLTEAQRAKMYTVQLRKLKNEAQIASLKTSDPAKYQLKKDALQKGTLGSIQRLLSTKEQMELFKRTQSDVRTQKSAKRKELMMQSASPTEIKAALTDIYQE